MMNMVASMLIMMGPVSTGVIMMAIMVMMVMILIKLFSWARDDGILTFQ